MIIPLNFLVNEVPSFPRACPAPDSRGFRGGSVFSLEVNKQIKSPCVVNNHPWSLLKKEGSFKDFKFLEFNPVGRNLSCI